MNCPACDHELKLVAVTGIKVLACEGSCGGFWFEWKEIKKLPERNAAAGADLLHVERAAGVRVFRNIQHPCPKCTQTLLHRHCFNRQFCYEVDQCSKCGGFWVDAGILADLLQQPLSADNLRTAKMYFKSLFEDSLAPENLSHPDSQEAARTIFQLFRFLTPTSLFANSDTLDPH